MSQWAPQEHKPLPRTTQKDNLIAGCRSSQRAPDSQQPSWLPCLCRCGVSPGPMGQKMLRSIALLRSTPPPGTPWVLPKLSLHPWLRFGAGGCSETVFLRSQVAYSKQGFQASRLFKNFSIQTPLLPAKCVQHIEAHRSLAVPSCYTICHPPCKAS